MSATNKTTNLELPLFVDSDTPTWLGDWNSAMEKIDSASGGSSSTPFTRYSFRTNKEYTIASGNSSNIIIYTSDFNSTKYCIPLINPSSIIAADISLKKCVIYTRILYDSSASSCYINYNVYNPTDSDITIANNTSLALLIFNI